MHQPVDRPERGPQDALCDVLAEEVWLAVMGALPAAVPCDVALAVMGEVSMRLVGMVARRSGMEPAALTRLFAGSLLAAAEGSE
jgi:hypothetical protein